jgi:predicted DNA-binding ribbon-helix-helix protein
MKHKFSIDIETKDLEKLQGIAKERDRSIGSLIREIIKRYLRGK